MPIGEFSPPKHWENVVSLALGLWLFVSPWTLTFYSDLTVTRCAFGFGVVLVILEWWTFFAFRSWEE